MSNIFKLWLQGGQKDTSPQLSVPNSLKSMKKVKAGWLSKKRTYLKIDKNFNQNVGVNFFLNISK